MNIITRPAEGEYPPYLLKYFSLVPEGTPLLEYLQNGPHTARELVESVPAEKLDAPCAPGEWTVKEILSHILDSERVFVYRALTFARGDALELVSVDQDLYVKFSGIQKRSIDDIFQEYEAVRRATLTFFNSLDEAALSVLGKMNGHPTSARSLAWLTAGHETHHLNSIRENYLQGL